MLIAWSRMVTCGHMQDGVTINARCNTVQYSRSEFIIACIDLSFKWYHWSMTCYLAHHGRARTTLLRTIVAHPARFAILRGERKFCRCADQSAHIIPPASTQRSKVISAAGAFVQCPYIVIQDSMNSSRSGVACVQFAVCTSE